MQASLFLFATNLLDGPVAEAMQRGDFGRGGRGHGPGGFFPLLMLIALALLGFWIWRNWSGRNNLVEATANAMHSGADRFKSSFTSAPTSAQNPLQVLQTRYAQGEISREEYMTIRADLVDGSSAAASDSANVADSPDAADADSEPDETK